MYIRMSTKRITTTKTNTGLQDCRVRARLIIIVLINSFFKFRH